MKKNIEKLFSKGNKINISIKAYATLYNRFLDRIESKKDRYSFDKVNQQNQQGKGPRPIVVIWSNKFHDKVIACSETTSKTNYNKKYSYKVSINGKIVYWK